MDRRRILSEIQDFTEDFDLLVIGGGATGLGTAWDAATRGFRTLLIEQDDFAQGTSSRSTKLIHGGLRYLQQFNLSLVRESLRERGLLLRNAPDHVRIREFVIPVYGWWDKLYYSAGLKAYDTLAGSLGIKPSRPLTRKETLNRLPGLRPDRLVGGVSYWDGQFDDAGLAIALVHKIFEAGGLAINHVRFDSFTTRNQRISGANLIDKDSGNHLTVSAKAVVNATGVRSDLLRNSDDGGCKPLIAASRGSHIVLPREHLPGEAALMIPKTDDGRVLFAIPWSEHLLVGTTDVAVSNPTTEPEPSVEEIRFLLDHLNQHISKPAEQSDILSTFAGLRPLVRSTKTGSTAALKRDHHIEVARSGLISVIGGKWTTFRKMAEDTVDHAITVGNLPPRHCVTAERPIEAWFQPGNAPRLDERLSITREQIEHAVKSDLALTLEDVLSRRSRCLFLNARATLDIAPQVASIMASALGCDISWQSAQLKQFERIALRFLPTAA